MLTFNEERHEYRWNSELLPGVTSILKDLSLTPPYAPGKSDNGTLVHDLTAQIDRGMLSMDEALLTCTDDARPFLEAYRQFRSDYQPRWMLVEAALADPRPTRWYAGTLDRMGYLLGEPHPCMCDIKCTASVAPTTEIQLAAYIDLAALRTQISALDFRLRVIQLKPNGRYSTAPDMKPRHAEWQAALTLWHWKNRTATKKGWE